MVGALIPANVLAVGEGPTRLSRQLHSAAHGCRQVEPPEMPRSRLVRLGVPPLPGQRLRRAPQCCRGGCPPTLRTSDGVCPACPPSAASPARPSLQTPPGQVVG